MLVEQRRNIWRSHRKRCRKFNWIEDFKVTDSKTNWFFLAVDEFAALRISMDKRKNLMKSMMFEKNILRTICERSHLLMALQKSRNICTDGAIRDNF